MTFNQFENILSTFSFLILLLTTSIYLREVFINSNTTPQSYSPILSSEVRTGSYSKKTRVGTFGINIVLLLITIQLISRGLNVGHFPLSNLYESLFFLAWCLLFLYRIMETRVQTSLFGIFIIPLILFLLTFTTFFLPKELQISQPLVPALQSNWLVMHVSVMILSYAALLIGCILSILYLVFTLFFTIQYTTVSKTFKTEKAQIQTTLLITLDSFSYRLIGIGFCFLTLGILSGAVWANETWGTYWSWDPKETWALITWFVFAIYLHARLVKGWEGKNPAVIAASGFFVIWICYLGVNLLGQGLHSYGFFSV